MLLAEVSGLRLVVKGGRDKGTGTSLTRRRSTHRHSRPEIITRFLQVNGNGLSAEKILIYYLRFNSLLI